MTKGRLPRTLSSALRVGQGPLSTTRLGSGLSGSRQQHRAGTCLGRCPAPSHPQGRWHGTVLRTQSPSRGASTATLHQLQPPPVLGWQQHTLHRAVNQTLQMSPTPWGREEPLARLLASSGLCISSLGTAGAMAGAPGSLVGGNGLGQPVEAVQVVVGGQVLLAGGTDGPGLEASSKHPCAGEAMERLSLELGPEHPPGSPWGGLPAPAGRGWQPVPVPGT